jgi:carbon-monoxide dehydrogenase small subunit
MKIKISFILNGYRILIEVEPQELLLDVLRDRLGVKSPKCGCDRGDCGSCTVMINGKTVRSCLVLAIEVDGQHVTTLEGLMQNNQLTPLQQAFIQHNSFQCGFCAPGMILSATELLERNPQPDEQEIKEAIAGNLCRCTGYQPIIDAITQLTTTINSSSSNRQGSRCRLRLGIGYRNAVLSSVKKTHHETDNRITIHNRNHNRQPLTQKAEKRNGVKP